MSGEKWKKSDEETVIGGDDALSPAKSNAGVSLDAKFSIDLRPTGFKLSLYLSLTLSLSLSLSLLLSYCCESIAASSRLPSSVPAPLAHISPAAETA